MLADELDYVVGVDPHRDTHALAIVHAGTGAAVFGGQVVASERGYAQALRRGERDAPGRRAWAIEGTGSYGAGLTRFLSARGERVLEVGRTRRERRSQAKTDAIDALRAARSVLGTVQLASPRAAGEREALRALMVARAGALAAKKAGLCQLRALLVTCPEPLRSELRSLTRARLLRRLAAVRPNRHQDAELRGTLIALRALARRVQALTAEERELKREIQALVARLLRPRPRPPARPRRRPAAQPRAAHDHRQSPREPRADDHLHRAQDPRGQERARGDPLPQAPPRPPRLPPARGRSDRGLTLIEASP
jgi:transposase